MPRDSKGKFTAEIDISVNNKSPSWLRNIVNSFGEITKAGKKASKAFELSADMKQAAENVTSFANDMAKVVKKPVQKFAEFEEQMDSVAAATFDLTKAMDTDQVAAMNDTVAELSATARQLGADTRYSATEAAAGMDILAKNFAGSDMEKAQAVIDAMPGILDTAAATKETIETAADVQSATMNQFGLGATDMSLIGDVLVKTANSSATGLVDLGEAMKYAGVTAHAAGIDLETTAAMIGALGNAGKKGSVAGTGLASVLSNVQAGAKKQKSALAALGINVADKKGNLKPIVELLAELERAADKKFGKGKGGVRRDRWLQGLVGMGGDKEALAILMKQAGTGELQELVEANKNAAGTAKLVATAMSDNTAGAARELDSALEEMQLTIGEEVIPMALDLLKWAKEAAAEFTAWAKENPELVKTIASVAGSLALVGFVVGPVIKGIAALTTIWGGLTYAMGAFNTVGMLLSGGTGLFKTLLLDITLLKTMTLGTLKSITMAMLTNPITLTIIGIATAALLVYEYWEPISAFFGNLWESVTAGFQTALEWILDKIGWVGEQIEAFKISIMTEDEATKYAAEKAANFEATKKDSALFADDLDTGLTSRGGIGDTGDAAFHAAAAASNADYALGEMANAARSLVGEPQAGPAAPSMAEWQAMADARPIGPSLLNEAQPGSGARIFDGKLLITVDSEGKVTKTSMRTDGDPNFDVRMNAGGQ